MKLRLPRDIPRRAAAAVVALALVAGVVAGRDQSTADPSRDTAPDPAPVSAVNATSVQPALPDLDLEKLNRPAKAGKITDLFAPKTAMLAPPPAPVAVAPPPRAPPPAPTAPPLPFRYFGKWVDGQKTVVFLWRNNEGYSASAGDTVDGTYRVESITESSVDFTYLPLGTKQTLPIIEAN